MANHKKSMVELGKIAARAAAVIALMLTFAGCIKTGEPVVAEIIRVRTHSESNLSAIGFQLPDGTVSSSMLSGTYRVGDKIRLCRRTSFESAWWKHCPMGVL